MPPVVDEARLETGVDLVYLFPGVEDAVTEALIRESFSDAGLSRFFASIRFVYAALDSERDHYVRENFLRPPNRFGLRSGPNTLFFHMMRELGEN